MLLLRELDHELTRIATTRSDAILDGTVLHPFSGQEPLAVGLAAARRDGDVIFAGHRGLGHCLAWGMDPRRALGEALGRAAGPARGRGGHMHVVDVAAGVGGTNGIVGAGMPLAVGAALALRRTGNVAVTCFGDGAANTGAFHESLNLAVVWRVPLVFVCEDNGLTEAMPSTAITAGTGLAQRARAYGVFVHEVDGCDVIAVRDAAGEAMERAREGGGPSAIVAALVRPFGHWSGDVQHYREKQDIERRGRHDAVSLALAAGGLQDGDLAAAAQRARRDARDLVASVLALEPPDRRQLLAVGEA